VTYRAIIAYTNRTILEAPTLEECCAALAAEWPSLDKWSRWSARVQRPELIDLGRPDGLSRDERDYVDGLLEGLS
jgi:hypothetical protein